jgi:hypothetical protein
MDEFEESRAGPQPKPSKIPSWIMLGFLLGAFFVWMLPRAREPETPVVSTPVRPLAQIVATHPRFSDVEASFLEWQRYAVWAGEVTYVCMWDSASLSFRDCYEVWRRGDDFFFRSIPRPKNLRALEGVPEKSPLEFLNPVPERNVLWEKPGAPALDPTLPPK